MPTTHTPRGEAWRGVILAALCALLLALGIFSATGIGYLIQTIRAGQPLGERFPTLFMLALLGTAMALALFKIRGLWMGGATEEGEILRRSTLAAFLGTILFCVVIGLGLYLGFSGLQMVSTG